MLHTQGKSTRHKLPLINIVTWFSLLPLPTHLSESQTSLAKTDVFSLYSCFKLWYGCLFHPQTLFCACLVKAQLFAHLIPRRFYGSSIFPKVIQLVDYRRSPQETISVLGVLTSWKEIRRLASHTIQVGEQVAESISSTVVAGPKHEKGR